MDLGIWSFLWYLEFKVVGDLRPQKIAEDSVLLNAFVAWDGNANILEIKNFIVTTQVQNACH